MFSSLGRSVAGGLVAIAVIVAGIVAVNSFQKDEPKVPVAATVRTPKPAGSAAASTAETAAESGATTTPPAVDPTETAPEVAPEASTSTAPAAAPGAAAPDSPEAAAVRVPLVVLNSSRIKGLAATAATDFEQARWTVRKPVGNTSYRAAITTVYYLPGQEAAARQLMRDVPAVQRILLRPLALPGTGMTVVVTREYAG